MTDTLETTHGVNLTDTAAQKVRSLLEQEGRDDLRLRVAVQPGGCSGLIYQLYFDERLLDGDVRPVVIGHDDLAPDFEIERFVPADEVAVWFGERLDHFGRAFTDGAHAPLDVSPHLRMQFGGQVRAP